MKPLRGIKTPPSTHAVAKCQTIREKRATLQPTRRFFHQASVRVQLEAEEGSSSSAGPSRTAWVISA